MRAALTTGTDDSTALATAAFDSHSKGAILIRLAERSTERSRSIRTPRWRSVERLRSTFSLVNYDKAIEQANQSIRLSPFDPLRCISEPALACVFSD
jgi:hypothetical protein